MSQKVNFGTKVTPAQQIVSLELAKKNSRIDFDDENDLLEIFVAAATKEIENYIGGPVLERNNVTIEQTTYGPVAIPFRINEITKLEWIDAEDAATEIADWDFFADEVNFDLDKPDGFRRLRVTCTAGYNEEDMPADIQRAALLIFSHADTYREDMAIGSNRGGIKIDTRAQALLRPYKNW